MTAAPLTDWPVEFGIGDRKPPTFFTSTDEIGAVGIAAPQPHVLRRAFEHLELDGILCQDNAPIIYFREMDPIEPSQVIGLRRQFWNQGVAPILVLITPEEVHIYSGLTQPEFGPTSGIPAEGFVEKLNRVAGELQKFILAVESGEYFHVHRRSFDPRQRVDRNLLRHLQAARERLDEVTAARVEPHVLDALLCRLVFTCYLFDRRVIDRDYLTDIDIREAEHLRDILGRQPTTDAKAALYKLFAQLGHDFNGDLFSDNLAAEAADVRPEHLDILNDFFRGTDPRSGQQSFWPFDFGIIPIETISAIYEHFLKATGEEEKKEAGAFYTPRFLAELILDQILDRVPSLLDKRFLDPACGSGIFLVGLFNRLAEEWNRNNPDAGYESKLQGLTQIVKTSLFGIDKSRTACLITAFSLYLALLDQLSPPDIRQVLNKVKVLPPLVTDGTAEPGTIRCADFFTDAANLSRNVHFVVGNPPWATVKSRTAPVSLWYAARNSSLPGNQIAIGFVQKASEHLEPEGKVCFVVPHGMLFNHKPAAIAFQQEWLRQHAVQLVLNLADYQRFLFEEAEAPAIVVCYAKEKPTDSAHRIAYWAPKTDWAVTQAEVIRVLPQDRSRLTVREILDDLQGDDAPLIWKERFWATPRDRRLLSRLSLMPRLRDLVGSPSSSSVKRWTIGQGFEEREDTGNPGQIKRLSLPTKTIVEATQHLKLIILEQDCQKLDRPEVTVRKKSNTNIEVYRAPHVLLTNWPKHSAFAGFDAVFRHAMRGIHGPQGDEALLMFLASYLQTDLAQFFLFHTSSNWGVSRAKVHVEELLRLPFPTPEHTHDPERCSQIVRDVSTIVNDAAIQANAEMVDRNEIAEHAAAATGKLVEEYFDIDDIERMLIADTVNVIIPSVRPTRARVDVPTIRPCNEAQRSEYTRLLCETLNGWASEGLQVYGKASADADLGIGMVVLGKTTRGAIPSHLPESTIDVLPVLHRLQQGAARGYGTLELVRGLKVFDKTLLYITKPLGQRFWTRTAALNDADELAGYLTTRSPREGS